jgi:hypothetical protein
VKERRKEGLVRIQAIIEEECSMKRKNKYKSREEGELMKHFMICKVQ